MRKFLTASAMSLAVLVLPGIALAATPTVRTRTTYLRAYHAVAHKFGHRAPGRNIVRWGVGHRPATNGEVVASIVVLRRMLAPPPPPVPVPAAAAASSTTTTTTSVAPAPAVATATVPSSGLAACIISRESGGNPQAVNPNGHLGLGQWDLPTWLAQGGGRYASTPLGASYAQQVAVLNAALANGDASAWTPYDHCG